MSKFLIEVPHDADKKSCLQAIRIFMNSGSHFLTHADWGCMDGEHRAWIIIEVDEKRDAINILPPAMRNDAKIVKLNRFSIDTIEKQREAHP